MGDSEVCKYERREPHPNADYSNGYIAAVFDYASDQCYQWGIELDGDLIGPISVVGINDFDEKAFLGYCLNRNFWNKGYTTEAVKAVLQFMFREVGLNRMEASHSVNNPASGKVLQKAGFALEGHAKEYYRCSLGFQDSELYGLTKHHFERRSPV